MSSAKFLCKYCDGTGKVQRKSSLENGYAVRCKSCHGTGQMEIAKIRKRISNAKLQISGIVFLAPALAALEDADAQLIKLATEPQ